MTHSNFTQKAWVTISMGIDILLPMRIVAQEYIYLIILQIKTFLMNPKIIKLKMEPKGFPNILQSFELTM